MNKENEIGGKMSVAKIVKGLNLHGRLITDYRVEEVISEKMGKKWFIAKKKTIAKCLYDMRSKTQLNEQVAVRVEDYRLNMEQVFDKTELRRKPMAKVLGHRT